MTVHYFLIYFRPNLPRQQKPTTTRATPEGERASLVRATPTAEVITAKSSPVAPPVPPRKVRIHLVPRRKEVIIPTATTVDGSIQLLRVSVAVVLRPGYIATVRMFYALTIPKGYLGHLVGTGAATKHGVWVTTELVSPGDPAEIDICMMNVLKLDVVLPVGFPIAYLHLTKDVPMCIVPTTPRYVEQIIGTPGASPVFPTHTEVRNDRSYSSGFETDLGPSTSGSGFYTTSDFSPPPGVVPFYSTPKRAITPAGAPRAPLRPPAIILRPRHLQRTTRQREPCATSSSSGDESWDRGPSMRPGTPYPSSTSRVRSLVSRIEGTEPRDDNPTARSDEIVKLLLKK